MKRRLLVAALLLLLLPMLGLSWLMYSESGLRWAYRNALPSLPGELLVGELSGSLAGPLLLREIEYRHPEMTLSATRLALRWNPWALWRARLDIENLDIDKLAIELPAVDGSEAGMQKPGALPSFELPLELRLRQLAIDGFEFNRGPTRIVMQRIGLGAALLHDRLEIDSVEVSARDYGFSLQGSVSSKANYPHEFRLSWRSSLPSGAELEGSGQLSGDLNQTTLQQKTLGATLVELKLEVTDLLRQPGWRIDANLSALDTTGLSPALPPLTGAARITASGDLTSATATGSVRIDSGLPLPIDAEFKLGRIAANADFSGLTFDDFALSTVDGDLEADGRVDWAQALTWEAQIQANNLNPLRLSPDWPGELVAELSTTGNFDAGKLSATVDIASLSGSLRGYPVQAQSSLRWLDDEINIDRLNFASGATTLSVNGRVGASLDLTWALASPDLAELYPAVSGQLDATGALLGTRVAPTVQARFKGSRLRHSVYHIGGIEGELALDLLQAQQIVLESQRLKLQFAARDLLLQGQPLQALEVDADNRSIKARFNSTLLDAQLELAGELKGLGWQGQALRAELQSPTYGNWSLQKPAALDLGAERISLRSLCLQQANQAAICANLDGAGEDWRVDAELTRFPLAWLSRWTPPELQAEGLLGASVRLHYRAPELLLGEARMNLEPGSLSYRLGEGRVEKIAYRGGKLNLNLSENEINASADLALRGDDSLTASLTLPGASALSLNRGQQPMQARAKLKLSDLGIADALLDEIEALNGRAEISLQVKGTLDKPQPQGEAKLAEVSFILPRLQLKVTQLSASAQSEGDTAVNYRLDATTAGGKIVVDGRSLLDPAAGWESEFRLLGQRLELARLAQPWLPPNITIDGRLDGKADLRLRLPDQLQGDVELSTSGGELAYPLPDGAPGRWEFREASLKIKLNDEGIEALTRLAIGDNNLVARALLPGARLLALNAEQQTLQANAELDFRDLSLLESLFSEVQQPSGSMQLNLGLSGTLALPRLQVEAELREAALHIPRLGLNLEQIGLTARTEANGELGFNAQLSSGEGQLSLQGTSQLDAARGWPTRFKISGSNFQAARVPEATITLSPDLTVTVEGRNIDVRGDLRVPYAKLQPRDITSAATASEDVVLIGGEAPVEEKWNITSRTNLILGDRVTFFGYGFEGQLGGNLVIEEKPGQPTRGSGVINIKQGRYRAYGQHLDIENGRLLFGGGPLTNPGLDIRAIRKTRDIIAGIQVGGRLQQPEIELFSSPAMGQTDTLAYLLTGGPLDSASSEEGAMMANAALALGLSGGDRIARSIGDRFGFDDLRVESSSTGDQASLVVGRYLSPRLYLSYGVGLIESINTLNLRYQISDKWRLETESGSEQGADLLYSIER